MSMQGAFIRDFVLVFIAGVVGYALGLHFGLRPGAMAVSAAALTVLVVQLLGGGLGQIGLIAPPRLWRLIGLVLLGIVLFYLLSGVAMALARHFGFTSDLSSFAYLRGNLNAYLLMLAIAWSSAAVAEEIVFRGFLLNRLRMVDGGGWLAAGTALLVSSALFGAGHFYQGPGGMIVTGAAGLALGITTLIARGNLWPAIMVHGVVDTIGLTILYLGLTPG
jgi:uncharacterized protein